MHTDGARLRNFRRHAFNSGESRRHPAAGRRVCRFMLLRGIRSRLLGLVLATVVPFAALIGCRLWTEWRNDKASAAERAVAEARLLAAQVDDHLGNLDALMAG